jgi:hypothetical protein
MTVRSFLITFHSERDQGPYSQYFIYFVNYEFAQLARVFVIGKTFNVV